MPALPPTRRLAYLAFATAGVLWGTSFLLGKVALREMGAPSLVLYRFVLAAAVLVPFVPRAGWQAARRHLGLLVGSSFLMGPVMFVLQFEGLDRTTASSAALLVGVAPPSLAVAAALFDGERPGRTTWAATALSVVGVGLLVGSPGPGRTLLGDTLVFVSMLAAVAWTLTTRRLARRLGVAAATGLQFLLGIGWLLPLAWALDGAPPVRLAALTWGALLGLGLLCTALTFGLWNWGLQRVEAAKAGVFGNLEPVVGAARGVLLLGERLGLLGLAGGALVLGAAWLATTDEPAEPAPDAVPSA
ncbi:MAG: DMT family transporter [Rubricoccaceae bacterium]|nr:DMT family transporter [Rubricoccaceae bacterium]